MTQTKFKNYSKKGKTVLTMDFIEGMEGACTTGAAGDPQIWLDQLAKKTAFLMLQLKKTNPDTDIMGIVNTLSDNVKVYFAKLAKIYLQSVGAEKDNDNKK